jgi:hypothetical protein
MGLEYLNPRNRTAEHLITGEDLLYYFYEPATGVTPKTEFETLAYTGTVVWTAGGGSPERSLRCRDGVYRNGNPQRP